MPSAVRLVLAGLTVLLLVGIVANLARRTLTVPPAVAQAPAPTATPHPCTIPEFQMLHAMMPRHVGRCLGTAVRNPRNGNIEQRTERGLLVWRADTETVAFTDGYRTWVLGPYGLQVRGNDERFAWERRHQR